MNKTIKQALIDELHYPLSDGYISNQLLKRGLSEDETATAEVLRSNEFIGATADCLYSLVAAPNVSEAGMSISMPDRDLILKQANALYLAIGEDEKHIDEPTVYVGW